MCTPCPHGKVKSNCRECNPCPHGKLKYHCVECKGRPHGKLKSACAVCNSCPHGKLKYECAECTPCPHGKLKDRCVDCNPCPHGELKRNCYECKHTPCPHGKLKRDCAECNPCPHGDAKRNCYECKRTSAAKRLDVDVPPARSELKPPKPPPTLVGHDERVFMVWTYTTKVSLDPEHPIQESPDYRSKPFKSFWWNTVTNATTALREPPPRDHGPGEKDKKTEKPTPEMWTPHISDGAPPPADEAPELVGTFFALGHANDCAKCQHDILGVGCFEEDDERNFLSRSQRLDELHVYHEDDDDDDDGKDEDGWQTTHYAHIEVIEVHLRDWKVTKTQLLLLKNGEKMVVNGSVKLDKKWNIKSMKVDDWNVTYVEDSDDDDEYGGGGYGNCGYDRYDSDSD